MRYLPPSVIWRVGTTVKKVLTCVALQPSNESVMTKRHAFLFTLTQIVKIQLERFVMKHLEFLIVYVLFSKNPK